MLFDEFIKSLNSFYLQFALWSAQEGITFYLTASQEPEIKNI